MLGRLQEKQLYAKHSKCSFGEPQTEYMGHWVGSGKRWADKGKIQAVVDWPRPTSVRDIQSFMGLANYYSCYIPNFASVSAPLTDL